MVDRWAGLMVSVLFLCATGQPQQSSQVRDLVRQAVRTEIAASAADHTHWLYFETDKKPGDGTTQWVAETSLGEVDRVLKKGDQALPIAEQRSRMDSFIHDSSAQARQRKNGEHDDREATEMLNTLPNAFIWTRIAEQNGVTTLHFKPDPTFRPPTWESRVFAAMEGDMTLDDAQHRIASLKGTLNHEVRFGYGVFGVLEPGGSFDVERRQIGKDEWEITETHVHLHGRALIFKSISEQEDDVKSKFEQLPASVGFKDVEEKLMAQSE